MIYLYLGLQKANERTKVDILIGNSIIININTYMIKLNIWHLSIINIITIYIFQKNQMQEVITHKKSEMQRNSDQLLQQSNEVEVVEGEIVSKKSLDEAWLKDDERQDHSQIDETSIKSQTEELNLRTEGQEHTLSVQNSGTSLSLEDVDTLKQDKETYLLSLKDDKGRKELQNAIIERWIDPKYLADKLMEWIECAEKVWNDWTILPDYDAKLRYIKEVEKLMWYTKKDPIEIVFRPITNPQNPI